MTETMSLERALEITAAICARSWATDISPDWAQPSLAGISLREMLDARDVVDAENARPKSKGPRTIYVVPDPRLIAAVYTFEHYEPSRQAVLSVPMADGRKRMLAVVAQTTPMRAANDEDAA